MLYFPLLWAVTSTNYYSSTKNKYQTFYVISYFIYTTLKFTDTK